MPGPNEKSLWVTTEETALLKAILEQASVPGKFARLIVSLQDKIARIGVNSEVGSPLVKPHMVEKAEEVQ